MGRVWRREGLWPEPHVRLVVIEDVVGRDDRYHSGGEKPPRALSRREHSCELNKGVVALRYHMGETKRVPFDMGRE